MSATVTRRSARRLVIAVLALAVLDAFMPGVLQRLETERYDSNRLFRFENSDLFALGPVVAYLQEHLRGDRPRVVFFGNSVVWGYFLEPADSLPAQFQRLTTDARVFNLAVNGFETGSAYLITKSIIEAVDTIYLFPVGETAHPMLPNLIRVERPDLDRFSLSGPDPIESSLRGLFGFWNLYSDAYRLQAAMFGTSTRLYLYLNKGSIPRSLVRRLLGRQLPEAAGREEEESEPLDIAVVTTDEGAASVGQVRRLELAAAYPLLWDFAELVHAHRKRAVVVEVDGHAPTVVAADRGDLNEIFDPHVSFVSLSIPEEFKFDGLHLTAEGSRVVAQALRRHAPPLVGID